MDGRMDGWEVQMAASVGLESPECHLGNYRAPDGVVGFWICCLVLLALGSYEVLTPGFVLGSHLS